ncbi:MAG: acyl-CoA carboxylase subunit epsilon [Pseudonocardiaceae bacterium]
MRGEPSDEELAALIVVLTGMARAAGAQRPAPHSAWAHPAHRLRRPLRPGPRAWYASALGPSQGDPA